MRRVARWRAPTRPPKSAASNPERLPPESPEAWSKLLGRKVSIRYALTGDPAHPFSEAVGVVAAVRGTPVAPVVTILKRDGTSIEVAAAAVLAGKVFDRG